MVHPLHSYFTEVAKRRGMYDRDIPRLQEVVRILFDFAAIIASHEPDDIEGDSDLCAEIVNRAIDVINRVDGIVFTEQEIIADNPLNT